MIWTAVLIFLGVAAQILALALIRGPFEGDDDSVLAAILFSIAAPFCFYLAGTLS